MQAISPLPFGKLVASVSTSLNQTPHHPRFRLLLRQISSSRDRRSLTFFVSAGHHKFRNISELVRIQTS